MLGLNPWALLAIVVLWAASCGSSYMFGHRNATNAAKAAYGESLKAKIAEAHAQAVVDMQNEAEAEETRQEVRTVFRDRVLTVQRAADENPSDCRVSEPVFNGVRDAIRFANNPAQSAKPRAMSTTAGAADSESR